jgi:hypothetical protein
MVETGDGSHQLRLHEAITRSLAGRTALLRLLPFSCQELKKARADLDKSSRRRNAPGIPFTVIYLRIW